MRVIYRISIGPIDNGTPDNRRRSCSGYFLLGMLLAMWTIPLLAQASGLQLSTANTTLQAIHRGLSQHADTRQLQSWQKSVTAIGHDADACMTEKNSNLSQTDKALGILGPAVVGEPENLTVLRQKLQNEQKTLSGELATCKVLAVASADLSRQIREKRDALLAQMLLRHDHDIWQQAMALLSISATTWVDEQHFWLTWNEHSIFAQKGLQLSAGIGIFLFALLSFLRGPLAKAIHRTLDLSDAQRNFYHYAPLLGGIAAVAASSYVTGTFSPLIALIFGTWGAYAAISMLLAWALRSSGIVSRHFSWEQQTLRSALRTLRFIALLSLFGLVWIGISPRDPLSAADRSFFVSAYHLVLLGAVLWLVWRTGVQKPFRAYPLPRMALLLALIGTAICTVSGYRNLSDYLFFGLLMSLLALGMGFLLSWGLAEFWKRAAQKSGFWQHFLRRRLRLKEDQPLPWITWFSTISYTAVWLGVAAFVLHAWGLTHTGFTLIWKYFITGFTIAGFHIQPFRWVIAAILLVILFNINVLVQKYLSDNSRIISHMESGARHSVLSILRYAGFIIAVLIALSTAGVALGNLAIVAGALSVGIGFGLQNIVNNFVSGLILLLERPIRVGDWIKVGTTQGYVQKMSIRYTLILTFDRTEVFVPNSELISGQVTNWTYTDSVLRLMIPFNVVHDADIPLVKQLLVAAGQNHPDVLQDDPRGIPPTALLLDVSENALQFCLRVYLNDCNKSYNVQTDLRASVVESLLRHNVALAHQQQDVHIIPDRILPADENMAQPTRGH
ncbi:MAG: mechanosensitive ion channel [Acidithiobacillus sp.]|nr:mechanosensitive ion channel [Acidithiobacillus sp.]